jgi:peptidoglycan/LPS O-acetylase OafA/YrhL
MQKSEKAVFFPGLNTVRFMAAFLVLINHIEEFKRYLGLPNLTHLHAIHFLGRLGVILFFVLSGFLITYLLLMEKEKFQTIDIKNFYIRRILRIWPLYYLMLILSLFIFPYISGMQIENWITASEISLPVILTCVFFLPNLTMISFPLIPFFSQAWSVGVEEQFYLIWPFLLRKFKKIARVLFAIILILFVIRIGLFPIIKFKLHLWNDTIKTAKTFFDDFLIDTMAVGGLFAYAHFSKSKLISFFYHPAIQLTAYAVMVYFMFTGNPLPWVIQSYQQNFTSLMFALLFGVLILNVSTNPKMNAGWFNNAVFDYLGKISYGIYMYHSIFIVLTIKIMVHYDALNTPLLYVVSILSSIGISALSYEYFEKFFLKRKNKFAKIQSTNSGKQPD